MIVDTIILYKLITKLVSPFTKWEAFRLGVIDADGNILVAPEKRTYQQQEAFTRFDVVCLNLKRTLAKIPGGSSTIGTAAAIAYYLKEPKLANENFEPGVEEIALYLGEDAPTVAVGGGAIAGAGVGPQGEPAKPSKKKKSEASVINNILRRNYRVNNIPNVGSA